MMRNKTILDATYWSSFFCKEKKFYFIFLLFLIAFQCTSFAQNNLSLSDAINRGLRNNFEISISKLELKSAQKQRSIGVQDELPNIRFKVDQTNRISKDGSPTSFVDGTYSKYELSGGLDLDWVLFHGFQVRMNKERLRQLERQSEGNSRLVIENTIEAIVLAYYQALIEKEKLKVFQEACSFSFEKLKMAAYELQFGELSQFEHYNFEQALLQDSINLYEQEFIYDQSLIELKTLIGMKRNDKIGLSDKLKLEEKNFKYSSLKRKLLTNNVDIKNEFLNLKLQENAIRLAKAEKKPRLSLRSGLNEELSSSKFSDENERDVGAVFDFYVNFSLSYQLFNKRDLNQRIQTEEIEKLIINKNIELLQAELEEKLNLRFNKYKKYQQILKLRKKLVDNLDKNLQLGSDRYKAGHSLFIEYRDLQLKSLEAKLGVLESIFELKIAETEIIRLTGGILKKKK